MSREKPEQGTVIFRRYRRVGNRVLDAHKYGYKAWRILIRGTKPKAH